MTPQTPLYEGKAKKIFSTSNPDELLVEYKNSLTAFNALKKDKEGFIKESKKTLKKMLITK